MVPAAPSSLHALGAKQKGKEGKGGEEQRNYGGGWVGGKGG